MKWSETYILNRGYFYDDLCQQLITKCTLQTYFATELWFNSWTLFTILTLISFKISHRMSDIFSCQNFNWVC